MKYPDLRLFGMALGCLLIGHATTLLSQPEQVASPTQPRGQWSVQYLGLTYHPNGGNTPEIYPLKMDNKAFLVLDVGAAANLDYCLGRHTFFRFTAALYKDCAFVTAGCLHLGPRLQIGWGQNRFNIGIGPILSFRQDWHRFAEYKDDEFYGRRVYKSWQYRLYMSAAELEYQRRISDRMEFQLSLIPGVPLIMTFLFGVRFLL